jgi:hypothetical protein
VAIIKNKKNGVNFMSSKLERKELMAKYKEMKHDAGVYRIINNETGEYLLGSDSNIKSIYNKFEFGKTTSSYDVLPKKLSKGLKQYGYDSFSIEILDLLDIKPEATAAEIKEELKLLEEMWREKLGTEMEY